MTQEEVPSTPAPPAPPAAPEKAPIIDLSLLGALQLAWELGYLIAIPAVAFGFGGAWLDKKYSVSPLFLILGFILAFTISTVGVVRKVRSITK